MTTAAAIVAVVALLGLTIAAVAIYVGVSIGAITVDTGWGRRTRRLGPLSTEIAASREAVYALLTQPYLGRTTRALAEKVEVLDRGENLVVAAHRTRINAWLTAVTVETVRFTPPTHIDFRLLRGPVPRVVERFTLTETAIGTQLDYTGELGTDFWMIGAWWGRIVARHWVRTVKASMDAVKAEAQRRA
jgi:polyketide cyclase/dehydrase/lipid transport protein